MNGLIRCEVFNLDLMWLMLGAVCCPQTKLSRVEAVEEQRTVLMAEMQRIKKAMLEQETRMRQVSPIVPIKRAVDLAALSNLCWTRRLHSSCGYGRDFLQF